DPGRREPPHGVDNGQLFCSHSRLRFLPEVELDSGASRIVLVWPDEWASIRDFYSVDSEVIVTCQCLGSSPDYPTFVTTPETCEACYTIPLKEEEDKMDYENGKIFIRKVNSVEDMSDVEEGDGLFPQASSAPKRKKLEHPALCETSSLGQVRRSTRNRRIRGEHEFNIASNQTLRDLKLQIMRTFSVAPYDQHLSLDGRPLIDNALTLSALQVVPGSRILLKADEPVGQIIMEEDYAKDTQPEEGFKGKPKGVVVDRRQVVGEGEKESPLIFRIQRGDRGTELLRS
uniref:Ubiquitin-like domain-containing protein n=1 Tax=Strigamia maritima TaxID=126957 RepID=T1JJE4_STRMM